MYCIVGIESVNYVSKQGNKVDGLRLYLTYESKKVDGLAVEQVYVSREVCEGLDLGMCVDFLYNKYGKVKQVTICG